MRAKVICSKMQILKMYPHFQNDESDAWDDSVLIKAYDDAVSAMKVCISFCFV